MCRMVVFAGACTRCSEAQTWTDLSQHLSCLEAKNKGGFGECSRGVAIEQHAFDQECDRCMEEDEGIGDLDDQAATVVTKGRLGKRRGDVEEDAVQDERKKQKT